MNDNNRLFCIFDLKDVILQAHASLAQLVEQLIRN
jgi:hypothetical protein